MTNPLFLSLDMIQNGRRDTSLPVTAALLFKLALLSVGFYLRCVSAVSYHFLGNEGGS